MSYPTDILAAIEASESNGLKVVPEAGVLTGFAGAKLTGLLQRFPGVTGGDYLEVGVFQGSSLLSTALANPGATCFGIDNYSQFDPHNRNRSLVVERADRLGITNYRLIDLDFEEGLLSFDGEVGTYFVDGPHDYRSQLVCLGYAPRFLKRGGMIIIDDANYGHVRQATADFTIMFPEYKLIFEAYTARHPINMSKEEETDARAGWWNGVHVIAHDPDDHFVGLVPPLPGNERFIPDHLIHGARYAPMAFEGLDLLQAFGRPRAIPSALKQYLSAKRKAHAAGTRYRSCNTESEGLPTRVSELR